MRTRLLLPLLLLTTPVHADTLAVLPGTSIQAKIDIAAPGDIVAIFGGTYNEDLTINKAIRLVEVSGQEVTITGSIAFTGITDCPPFEGFNFGSAGRGISVINTTGMVLRNLTGLTSSGVVASGSSTLKMVDCNLTDVSMGGTSTLKLWNSQIRNLTAGGTSAEVWNCTLSGGISQTAGTLYTTSISVAGNFDTSDASTKTVAFRTTVAGDCNWRSNRSWFGYGKTRSFNFYSSDDQVVFVGNEVDRLGARFPGMLLDGFRNNFVVVNCHIHNVNQSEAIIIRYGSCSAVIQNNYFATFHGGSGIRDRTVRIGQSTDVVIQNNIFEPQHQDWNKCVNAPFGVKVVNNLIASDSRAFSYDGGVVATGNINADPLFVENEAPKLQPESPCINAGTPDARYNDRDGSRNDIGPSGGAWFDPDGWTTENPVVISFDLSPDQVLEGVDTEVILSEGQAVSAP